MFSQIGKVREVWPGAERKFGEAREIAVATFGSFTQVMSMAREKQRRLLAEALRSTGYPESKLRLTFAPPSLFASIEPLETGGYDARMPGGDVVPISRQAARRLRRRLGLT